MTTVRQAQTAWRLLRCNALSPLRCPTIAFQVTPVRPISILQSRAPSGTPCTSRLFVVCAGSLPSFPCRYSTYSAPPGTSFVKNPSIREDQDAPPATPPQQEGYPQQEQIYQRPSYELTFTCKPCGHRSTHTVTKQAYHFGTILIRCPGCKDRHVISDHLKIFNEKPMGFEDILAGQGQMIKKAIRTEEDTIEFLE